MPCLSQVERLTEEEPDSNTASLPVPTWNDKKLKDDDNKQEPKLPQNMDPNGHPILYEREKVLGNSNNVTLPPDSTYNR